MALGVVGVVAFLVALAVDGVTTTRHCSSGCDGAVGGRGDGPTTADRPAGVLAARAERHRVRGRCHRLARRMVARRFATSRSTWCSPRWVWVPRRRSSSRGRPAASVRVDAGPPRQRAAMREVAGFALWRSLQVSLRPAALAVTRFVVAATATTAVLGQLEAARIVMAPVLDVMGASASTCCPPTPRRSRQDGVRGRRSSR